LKPVLSHVFANIRRSVRANDNHKTFTAILLSSSKVSQQSVASSGKAFGFVAQVVTCFITRALFSEKPQCQSKLSLIVSCLMVISQRRFDIQLQPISLSQLF